jgi:hypothetical protein
MRCWDEAELMQACTVCSANFAGVQLGRVLLTFVGEGLAAQG